MMKMNKWTMALAAAGVVSLSSVAQAQEAAAGAEALAASTTLSGYVSTSYTFDGEAVGQDIAKTNGGSDSQFSLDVVSLTLASAQGAGEYATGYTVQLWAGTNDGAETDDQASLEQANIDLRLPFGNGIDLKVGKMGTVVGNEVYDYNQNAFFQRSVAFSVQPTHHTGVLASYQVTDDLAVQVGFVNDTKSNTSNPANNEDTGSTATLASVGYTLPDSMGFAGGTGIKWATVRDAGADGSEQDNDYFQLDLPTIVEGLSLQGTADYVTSGANDDEIYGIHAGYSLNDKATLNLRYEFGQLETSSTHLGIESVAVGVTYDLWENVTSRVEWMSTSSDSATYDDDTLAINLVYSF